MSHGSFIFPPTDGSVGKASQVGVDRRVRVES